MPAPTRSSPPQRLVYLRSLSTTCSGPTRQIGDRQSEMNEALTWLDMHLGGGPGRRTCPRSRAAPLRALPFGIGSAAAC
jgi:hypothetical protein